MQQTLVSFVQADIEIGQSQIGLTESSDAFLNYYKNRADKPTIAFDKIDKIEQTLSGKTRKFFDEAELNSFSFENYRRLAKASYRGLCQNQVNVNFGGDHSLSLATVEASLRKTPNTLVIWIDAHADLNCAEESLSGHLHGMPVYYLLQDPKHRPESLKWMTTQLPTHQIVYFGIRDIDPFERDYLESQNIMHFTVHDIKTKGLQSCLDTIFKKIESFEKIHVSFDIDCLDTKYSLCTGVPVNNGLSLLEVWSLAKLVSSSGKLANLDIVEINPRLVDANNDIRETYEIALQFIQQITQERSPHASIYSANSARA